MKRVRELFGEMRHVALVFALLGLGVVTLPACNQDDGVGGAAPEDVETVRGAVEANTGGFAYWNVCQANSVPFPNPWGPTTIDGGTRVEGKWHKEGPTFFDSYITGGAGVDVYTMTSSSPAGTCAIAIRADGTFDVLCQGTNGKACFWEATMDFWQGHDLTPFPPQVPTRDVTIVGLIPAAPDQGVQCTVCHAGGNAFITHVKPDNHPTNKRTLPGWATSNLFEPVAPSTWPQNKEMSTADYPNQCTTRCHTANAGPLRFPALRNPDFSSQFCSILWSVTNRPASQGGMPPDVADCTPGTNCPADNDPQVQAMLSACGVPRKPTSLPGQSFVFGLGPPYGVGVSQLATKMHVSAHAQGMHQHFFTGATTTMPNPGCCTPHQNPHPNLASDDTINIAVWIPTGDKPREIMIQFTTDGVNWQRAFWGDDLLPWSPRTRMGGVPATGSWQPLAFRPVHLGVFGPLRIQGLAYTLYSGSAYFADTLFRQAASPYLSEYVSQMWVKDSLPAGATPFTNGGDTWTFMTP